MANPLVLIVPINLSINKPVYGRFLGEGGIDFGTQTIDSVYFVSSLHCAKRYTKALRFKISHSVGFLKYTKKLLPKTTISQMYGSIVELHFP